MYNLIKNIKLSPQRIFRTLGLLIMFLKYFQAHPHINSNNNHQYKYDKSVNMQNLFLTDNFELSQIKFLSHFRRKRDLSESDYHIIELTKSDETSFVIHLQKKNLTSNDFRSEINEGGQNVKFLDNNEINCYYSGIITSSNKSSENYKGVAAFSSCNNNLGFTGFIMDSKGHYMIEPHPVQSDLDSNFLILPHILYALHPNDSSTLQNHFASINDQLRIPDIMKKFNTRNFDDVPEEVDDSDLIKDHPHSHETIDIMNDTHTEVTLIPLFIRQNKADETKIKMTNNNEKFKHTLLQSNSNGNKQTSKVQKLQQKSEATTSMPDKKDTTGAEDQKVVEIAIFADPDFYSEMKIRYPSNTTKKVTDYILTLVNAMDMLYEQKSLGLKLMFRLVKLEIMTKWPSGIKKSTESAKSYLLSFCDYAGKLNIKNELWDHSLLLTGSDLKEAGSYSLAGLAWAGTMCYRYYSCSISEGLHLGAVYVITHEIGHSMGMEHDGIGISSKCDENKYIMSPTTGAGKVTWSECSSENLKNFIKNGSPELKKSKESVPPICLTTSSRESSEINYKSLGLPGQKYSSELQCKLALGKKFSPVMRTEEPYDNICHMLYCGNRTHASTTHAALEGTDCSTGKYCRGGNCVLKTID